MLCFEKMGWDLLGGGGGLGLYRTALLLADRLQDDRQTGDGGQHGAQDLSLQGLLGGQLGQSCLLYTSDAADE